MKKKKYGYLALFSFLLSLCVASFFILPAIDMNSNQEYCTVTALVSGRPREPEITYVKIGGEYHAYDPSVHQNAKAFYIKKGDIEFSQSNWQVQNMLCQLKLKRIFYDYVLFSTPVFLISFSLLAALFFLAGTIFKTSKPRRKSA